MGFKPRFKSPVAQALEKAAEKIQPESWGHGAYARRQDGRSVSYKDPMACKFCAYGFLQRYVSFDLREEAARQLRTAITEVHGKYSQRTIIYYNDSIAKSAAEVRKMFLRAAKIAG